MKALNSLKKFSSAGGLLSILREVDLGAVQLEAETRFSVLLLGDDALTRPLAESLCIAKGEERAGYIHPWLTRGPLSADAVEPDADLTLLVLPYGEDAASDRVLPETSQGLAKNAPVPRAAQTREVLTRLAKHGVPTLSVVVGAEHAEAEVPHKHETARVRLGMPSAPSWSDEVEAVLVPAVLDTLPETLHLAAARHLPRLRASVTRALIGETSRANAVYTASTGVAQVVPVLGAPLGVADMVILTKNQLVMAYKVALASGKKGKPQEVMGEIVSVLGGGFLFRQAARQLVGLVPVWGLVPKVAVAYAGTWAIGQSVQLWATKGRVPNQEDVRGFYDVALERGRVLAGRLMNREEVPELGADNAESQRKRRFRLPEFRRTSPKVSPELPSPEEDEPD